MHVGDSEEIVNLANIFLTLNVIQTRPSFHETSVHVGGCLRISTFRIHKRSWNLPNVSVIYGYILRRVGPSIKDAETNTFLILLVIVHIAS